jgi:enterochelin esterase-like enzyme
MPDVGTECVTFRFADPRRTLEAVVLVQEVARPRVGPSFVRPANGPEWVATLALPDVGRMEYLLELHSVDGRVDTVPDPANALRAEGPFGHKSVVELPGYQGPAWLDGPAAPSGTVTEVRVTSRALHRELDVVLWTSAGHDFDEELPLLVVHDGVEYALYSGLLALLDRAVARGRLPACHAALLIPSRRDDDYSASRAYARALVEEVMTEITSHVSTPATPRSRVAMGASLGGLAMLHAHRHYPGVFGALFLQSATLFLAEPDVHEAGRPHFRRIVRFVRGLLDPPGDVEPVPMVLTCGTVEENLHGNRAVAAALEAASCPVRLVVVRDAHNWTAWRDNFDPHLLALLTEMWS